jgi:hypothetical protein
MSSQSQIVVSERNWAPLKAVVATAELGDFMYMGSAGEIELYKHRFTRRYLNVSFDARRFYKYRDGEYVEISREAALDHVRR